MEVHQQNEPASHRQGGLKRGTDCKETRKARLSTARKRSREAESQAVSRRGKNHERMCLTIRKRSYFFNKQKFKEEKVSE